MSRDTVPIVLGRPNRAALLNKRTVIDHLIREIKMNAVVLHHAQRGALFPETLVGQFSLLGEIVKRLQPHEAHSRIERKLPRWGHDRDTQTPQL